MLDACSILEPFNFTGRNVSMHRRRLQRQEFLKYRDSSFGVSSEFEFRGVVHILGEQSIRRRVLTCLN